MMSRTYDDYDDDYDDDDGKAMLPMPTQHLVVYVHVLREVLREGGVEGGVTKVFYTDVHGKVGFVIFVSAENFFKYMMVADNAPASMWAYAAKSVATAAARALKEPGVKVPVVYEAVRAPRGVGFGGLQPEASIIGFQPVEPVVVTRDVSQSANTWALKGTVYYKDAEDKTTIRRQLTQMLFSEWHMLHTIMTSRHARVVAALSQ